MFDITRQLGNEFGISVQTKSNGSVEITFGTTVIVIWTDNEGIACIRGYQAGMRDGELRVFRGGPL